MKRNSGLRRGEKGLRASSPLSSRSSLQSRSQLRQGTGLSSGSGLRQTASLKSSSTLSSDKQLSSKSKLTAKKRVQSAGELEARKLVKQRSGGVCEICGRREATDMAHRVGAGVGGGWLAENLLHACRHCHSDNHEHPARAYEKGQHLRSGSDPLVEPVWLGGDEGSWWRLLADGTKQPAPPPQN